jgi:hypothetical protein
MENKSKELIERSNELSRFFLQSLPDGWEKHNALCNLQQSVWWALKGLDQSTPIHNPKESNRNND